MSTLIKSQKILIFESQFNVVAGFPTSPLFLVSFWLGLWRLWSYSGLKTISLRSLPTVQWLPSGISVHKGDVCPIGSVLQRLCYKTSPFCEIWKTRRSFDVEQIIVVSGRESNRRGVIWTSKSKQFSVSHLAAAVSPLKHQNRATLIMIDCVTGEHLWT